MKKEQEKEEKRKKNAPKREAKRQLKEEAKKEEERQYKKETEEIGLKAVREAKHFIRRSPNAPGLSKDLDLADQKFQRKAQDDIY